MRASLLHMDGKAWARRPAGAGLGAGDRQVWLPQSASLKEEYPKQVFRMVFSGTRAVTPSHLSKSFINSTPCIGGLHNDCACVSCHEKSLQARVGRSKPNGITRQSAQGFVQIIQMNARDMGRQAGRLLGLRKSFHITATTLGSGRGRKAEAPTRS